MEHYEKLLEMVESYKEDFKKFYEKGNKTAGIRVRKYMQELRSYAKLIREDVQEVKQKMDDD